MFRKRIFSNDNILVRTVVDSVFFFLPSVDYPEDGAKLCLFYIDGDNSYWLFYNVSNIFNSCFFIIVYICTYNLCSMDLNSEIK